VIDLVVRGSEIHAEHLRELLGNCPICHADFTGHRYAQFAMTINADDQFERVSGFLKAADERRWEELCAFQEFQGDRDTIIATALRCAGRRMALILEHDPYSLDDSHCIISCETLELEIGQQLGMIIADDKWHSLAKTDW